MNSYIPFLQAAVPKLQRKHGYFDLLGFDFMVTSENKLVLLEINTNPALSLGKIDEIIHYSMLLLLLFTFGFIV